jgi:M6 family metalloprotease-like protein
MSRKKIFVVIMLVCFSSAWALEPPTKEQLEQYQRDGTLTLRMLNALALGNHLVAPELVKSFAYRIAYTRLSMAGKSPAEIQRLLGLPPGTTNVLKSKGTSKIFVLLLSFPDYPASQSPDSINGKIFGDGAGEWPRESLRNYYRRASYNMLEIQGAVLGWYQPAYTRASVAQTSTARENLIKEALTYFDNQGHDFSQYDNDGNNVLDYFIVIWTGPNNGWGNFWWGYQASFNDQNFKLDGKSLYQTRYSWQWESNPYPGTFRPYVVIHETGHALGLPDYYDYDATVGPKGGVGGLDMMDANQGDHNCFSKMLMDWISPQVFNYGSGPFTLGASAITQDALIVMPEFSSESPFDEFYMVQNRLRLENDANLYGDGLLIWHVDARLSGNSFKYNNSYTEHKLLRLMEADGLEHIEKGYSSHAADYYVQGKAFTPQSIPNSSRYDASESGVSVFGISPNGVSMTFAADIHYTLLAPQNFVIERQEGDFIFFREYINKLSWELNLKNRTSIVSYKLYKKAKEASDSTYILLAELDKKGFEHRGLKKDDLFTYRIIAVDKNGVESIPGEVSN